MIIQHDFPSRKGVQLSGKIRKTYSSEELEDAVIGRSEKVYGAPVIMGMIGVQDRFGGSGSPWELIKEFEVSAEHITAKAKTLHDLKSSRG